MTDAAHDPTTPGAPADASGRGDVPDERRPPDDRPARAGVAVGPAAGADDADAGAGPALGQARPDVDRLRLDAARARVEQALFGTAAPARIGRYLIIDTAGRGGMGVVYRAYDPQLDRKVALKVVSTRGGPDGAARERLRAEARTLAQLAHPNVVPVHDALVVGDDVVVVMELIDGVALDAWVGTPRRVEDIVAAYAQAARGLAAAHEVGVIHRDFKPANAVMGRDGRVRVVDFGLARLESIDDATGTDDAAVRIAGPALTAAGALVGTPAYMAPEQLAGGDLTAAADQFAFWVSLYEAIAGVRPFHGDDRDALRAAIAAGRLTEPRAGRALPGWLRQCAARGLAADPAARFASMHQVVVELTRVRGWRRARVPIAVGGLAVVAGVAVVAAMRGGAPAVVVPTCDGGVDEIDAVAGADAIARVRQAIRAQPSPYAAEAERQVLGGLARYRAAWIDQHRTSCQAHQRGALSSELFDRSMACLARRRGDLRSAVDVLGEIDATGLASAVDVVVRLAPIASCGDREALAVGAPPVADPARRAVIAGATAQLGHATALDAAGRAEAALREAGGVVAIGERLGYAPLVVDGDLLIGRNLLFAGETERAIAPLRRAEETALASGQIAAAVIAGARRLYCEGLTGRPTAELERQFALLEPLSRGVARDPLARPLLLNNMGCVYLAAGTRPRAVELFREAAAANDALTERDPELLAIALNLGVFAAPTPDRDVALQAVLAAKRAIRGPDHPQTLASQMNIVAFLSDRRAALELAADLASRLATVHPDQIGNRVEAMYAEAEIARELGDEARALARFGAIQALVPMTYRGDYAEARAMAEGELALADGDLERADRAFVEVRARLEPSLPWYSYYSASSAEIGRARVALARGDRRRARVLLDDAIRMLDDAITRNENRLPHAARALAIRLREQT